MNDPQPEIAISVSCLLEWNLPCNINIVPSWPVNIVGIISTMQNVGGLSGKQTVSYLATEVLAFTVGAVTARCCVLCIGGREFTIPAMSRV